jgi:tetratricopeptide (TPR) repeat protein
VNPINANVNGTEERWLYFLDDEVAQSLLQAEPNLAEFAPGIRHKPASSATVTRAVIAALEGRKDEALAALKKAAAGPEVEADALAFLAYLEVDRERCEEALGLYERVIAKEPAAASHYYNTGLCHFRLGRWKEAAAAFQTAQEKGSGLPRVEFPLALAICHLHLFEPQQAIAYFDQVLAQQPDHESALFGKAAAYQYLREYDAAERLYAQLDEIVLPDSPVLATMTVNRLSLAMSRQNGAGDEEAIRKLSERLLASADPLHQLAAHEALANLSFLKERFTDAAKHCEKIIELSPQGADAWFNLGVARHHLGLQRPAMEAYLQAIEIDPSLMQAQANLGMLHHQRAELDQARRCYVEALHHDPSLAETLWNLGILLEQGGHQAEASVCYEQLTQLAPDWEEPWFRLATGHLAAGRWQPAHDAYAACLQLRSDWLAAGEGLALAKAKLGDEPTAIELLERIRGIEPAPLVLFNLAVLHQNQGREELAVQYYREAVEMDPDYPEALLNLGHAMKNAGNPEEAQVLWKRAVRLRPVYAAEYFA